MNCHVSVQLMLERKAGFFFSAKSMLTLLFHMCWGGGGAAAASEWLMSIAFRESGC